MPYESDPIAIRLNEFFVEEGGFMMLLQFDDLNDAEKALAAIWELTQEVYNGGFMQYFMNSSALHATAAREVLQEIGAEPAASIVQRAIALVAPGISWHDDVRRFEAIRDLPDDTKERLSRLGRELSEQYDEVHRLLWKYLAQHHDQLDAPEDFWKEFTIQ